MMFKVALKDRNPPSTFNRLQKAKLKVKANRDTVCLKKTKIIIKVSRFRKCF